jgi:hypothetical protein
MHAARAARAILQGSLSPLPEARAIQNVEELTCAKGTRKLTGTSQSLR